MHYYTFELDEESQDLCTIITPFGKYKYLRMPQGIKVAPDIAQAVMTNLFRHMDEVSVFLDDASVWTNDSFETHLESIRKVLTIL